MINQEMKKHLDSCAQERQGLKEVIDGHEKVLSQYENVVNELEKELEHCHLQIQALQDAKVVTEEQLEALENDVFILKEHSVKMWTARKPSF